MVRIVAALTASGVLLVLLPTKAAAAVDYSRDIKPIFERRCYSCHSRLKQKGQLRLDAGALVHKGGKDGPVIKPGQSNESELFKRITSTNADERMPPDSKPLSTEQSQLLKQWIDTGAPYPKD